MLVYNQCKIMLRYVEHVVKVVIITIEIAIFAKDFSIACNHGRNVTSLSWR